MDAAYTINSALNKLLRPLRHSKFRFVTALAFVLIALALTGFAQVIWGSSVVLIFAAAIIASTALYGFLAGIGAAALAALTVDFFYIPPVLALNLDVSTLRIAVEFGVLVVATHFITRKISNQLRLQAYLDEVSRTKIGVLGEFDGIVDGEAYGWAYNADDPSSPVNLVVYVNQKPVTEVAAVYYRPDVASSLSCSGRHGFYVDLRNYCPPDTEAAVDVRLSDPKALVNSPMQAIIPAPIVTSSPAILFMHIPKTAGTSIREAIVTNYKESEIAYLYPDPPGFLVNDLRLLPLDQRSHFRLVAGHFQYGVHDFLPQKSTYITFVRHPFARVVSHYLSLLQTHSSLLSEGDSLLSLEAALEQNRTVNLDNVLVRFFSGVDEKDLPPGMVDQTVYDVAIHHLKTNFAFVGHQECTDRSYAAMSDLFGWTRKCDLGSANRNPNPVSAIEQEKYRKAVEHYNRWDYLLYAEILRLYPQN